MVDDLQNQGDYISFIDYINEVNLMKKYFSVFLVFCSLFIYSNSQAQLLGDILKKAVAEADQEQALQLQIRLRDGSKIAPTLIPQAKIQSELGSYLVEELTIQNEAEKNKQKRRNIQREIRKIEKDLGRLDTSISGWESGDYSADLDKDIGTFSKYTKKYNNIVAVERERLAALEKARQEKLAAAEKAELERLAVLEKARQEKLAAFIERCEPGGASDDPFAAFNATQEPRMDLVLSIGNSKMKLQATKNGNCMWLGNYSRSDVIPALVTEGNFQQNPNNTTQYSLEIDTSGERPAVTSISPLKFSISIPGRFILDFEKYRCSLLKEDGSQQQIPCDDGIVPEVSVAERSEPAQMTCQRLIQMFENNATAATQELGFQGTVRLAECLAKLGL